VELPNTIEGFIDVSKLYDDYYHFSENEYAMIGEHTGKRYTIGDIIKVKVRKADKQTRTIEFVIPYEGDDRFAKGKRKQTYSK
jgi:ribonuclease R